MWDDPRYSGLLALLAYGIVALRWNSTWQATPTAYFNYLADAFLHGMLHLRLLPPTTHDLVYYGGQYYLYWPPLPAILLMPFVALFGVQFSDVLLTVSVGALNVALVSALLRAAQRRDLIDLTPTRRGGLVLFFALGTVHFTLAPFGRVWPTGQLVAFAGVACTYLAALNWTGVRAFLGVGLGVAVTFLTRNHMAFSGLWPLIYLVLRQRHSGWRPLAIRVLVSSLPVVAALALVGAYNYLRFGSVFDTGVNYHQMSLFFAADFQRYGVFNLHYLPINLFYQFVAYPLPYTGQTFMGGGLFWLSPVFAAAVWGITQGRPRWSTWALVATIGLVATPILLLMGTGWMQFGPRYSLDYMAPLLLLTAQGFRYWPPKWVAISIGLSIVQYAIGVYYWGTLISSGAG
jgi:hypothetical protein